MKQCDKRILSRMQEDERKQYEQDLTHDLPDLLEASEFVDTHLLMSQLPSRRQQLLTPDNNSDYAPQEAQEQEG